MTFTITLSWPSKSLSPNARVHWSKKARAAYAARHGAFYAARKAGLTPTTANPPYIMEMAFYPPDRRHRDDDNLIASMKPHRDAIAEAGGFDDKFIRYAGSRFEEPVKGGKVVIELREHPVDEKL